MKIFTIERAVTGGGYPWRRVFAIDRDFIGFKGQYKSDDKWSDNHANMFGLSYGKWRWGESHVYYDGPHCMRAFGFLHVIWSGGWDTGDCDKCYSGEYCE